MEQDKRTMKWRNVIADGEIKKIKSRLKKYEMT